MTTISVPLQGYLSRTAEQFPKRCAVCEGSGASVTYEELDAISAATRDRLRADGVTVGDRVGLYLPKSIDSVAAIFGILKVGAAYVPVDPGAPVARNAFIFANCEVRVVIVAAQFAEALQEELANQSAAPALLVVGEVGGGKGLQAAVSGFEADEADAPSQASDLAYILYTSGSTGKPKGVQISHGNAVSFIEWCRDTLKPTEHDRFSAHAPFHFDLSILDIYTAVSSGARLVLIDEETGKNPPALARCIAESGITVWYSAPSILSLLVEFGGLEQHEFAGLHTVIFAGEVFPVARLRALKNIWVKPRYLNLYGPTETNVCTYYEIPAGVPDDRLDPYPIGRVCEHLRSRVVDVSLSDVTPGEEGELCISGPSVTRGYWALPEQTERAYLPQTGEEPWYRTGDIVYQDDAGDYVFVGRRDRMVKRRGFRVELGEIESCLYQHPDIVEAAVTAVGDAEAGIRIVAHLATRDQERLSVIALKQFSAKRLPVYMVPDAYVQHQALPKTSTDKIDYQSLLKSAE